jgi:hypothetical protein
MLCSLIGEHLISLFLLTGDLVDNGCVCIFYFVEGHVGHYEKLIVNRPNAININAALSNETKMYHYLHRMKPSAVDGILEFMEEKFIKKCHKM